LARVSIMMPCYEAEKTIRLAISSVRAQTLDDWECLCVDDGSADRTHAILTEAAERDPRFRVFRFPSNRGRGAARQFLLERVSAPLLAFLDSDDWMFPQRLAHQVAWLESEPGLQAVSAPMAIFDESLDIVGEATPKTPEGVPAIATMTAPRPPSLFFPSSMIRTDKVQGAGFDVRLRRSQDSDMLIRALIGERFALTSSALYAYRRAAMTLDKTLEGYRYRAKAHVKHWRAFPLEVSRTLLETYSKMAVYKALGTLRAEHHLLDARYGSASDDAVRQYRSALATVREFAEDLWPA